MHKIGEISGFDVMYNDVENTVHCKHVTVDAQKLVNAYDSPVDRISLGPNLVMRKRNMDVTLGCLAVTFEIAEQIKKQINGNKTRTKLAVNQEG